MIKMSIKLIKIIYKCQNKNKYNNFLNLLKIKKKNILKNKIKL